MPKGSLNVNIIQYMFDIKYEYDYKRFDWHIVMNEEM